jgi:hypothetical protein
LWADLAFRRLGKQLFFGVDGGPPPLDLRTTPSAFGVEVEAQTNLLRCIFGDPFQPLTVSPAVLAWNDATVVRLAQAAYEERHMPEGTLDNGRLAVLADALEEAGCTDQDILNHLRGPGPHVRGCWAVDLLLDKE